MPISKLPQVFPRAEFLRRLAAVKDEMAKRDVEALVVTDNAHITYLTGSTARSFDTRGLVVSAREEQPTFILRWMDVPAAFQETFLDRDKVIGYPEELMGNPSKNGYDAVIDFLLEAGLADGRVGLEMGTLTVHSAEKFRARLQQAQIEDFSDIITSIRSVKNDLEIAVMKEAAAIADAGILHAAKVISPGMREADAIAEIVGALARGANGKPGTWITTPFLGASSRIGSPHVTWSEDVFGQGSQINLEIAGVRHGYTAPICRTFSIGKPSDRLLRIHEAQLAGLEVGLNSVRAGAVIGDVAHAIHRATERLGFKKRSRPGYGIGIDWMERTLSLQEGNLSVLKPNMTFHLHLGTWVEEDFGYSISESIRVTESGVEVLTKVPRELFVLG
ncbi:Xaa-Pro peptidase family protein [Mesorhizobium sp.]|uniref:M24 family metallopeptidase n=1 Tax=Mesorhizobium sp. TaxID=1871066 RepID=UPI000FE73EA1|nr:Xaa-Pro peptidase family protein [Mesorhizobium sp.]RWL09259.1 MAG: M24 family metallopeptidase [Mesorhizobium sp.]